MPVCKKYNSEEIVLIDTVIYKSLICITNKYVCYVSDEQRGIVKCNDVDNLKALLKELRNSNFNIKNNDEVSGISCGEQKICAWWSNGYANCD